MTLSVMTSSDGKFIGQLSDWVDILDDI